MPVLRLPISDEDLARLEGEGDFAFFVTLRLHGEHKVVQVHLRHRKFYDLAHARRGSDAQPSVAEGVRIEMDRSG